MAKGGGARVRVGCSGVRARVKWGDGRGWGEDGGRDGMGWDGVG